LWEVHLIEGLDDGRYAMYFKVHHAVVDGVSALRLLARVLSEDPDERDMPAPWALRRPPREPRPGLRLAELPGSVLHGAADLAAVLPPALRMLERGLGAADGAVGLSAPRSMLNVPITGARRFAAQSWPIERIRRVGQAAGTTVNDVVLAMCAGALRGYLSGLAALPEEPLIAMVPVSLHPEPDAGDPDGGNAIGAVLCNLGTDLTDPAARLSTVHRSMQRGKQVLAGLNQLQILALSALTMAPVALGYLLRGHGRRRPPFNIIISNVPGPRTPRYWNGARLDGLYPLSVPIDGQALNITCTSYSDALAFGLTGCRRSVPHLQQLLGYLDQELAALERATGVG
jgi:diacylglycerol O-acyltransferase